MGSFDPRTSEAGPTAASEESGPEKSQLDEALEGAYEDARLEASSEMGLPLKIFPHKLPFDYSEIMERLIVWPGDEE
jgi:Domain of unknown function DUF29